MTDTPPPTNGSQTPFVYVSNRQIWETLQRIESNLATLMDGDVLSRLRILERFMVGAKAVIAIAIPAMPVLAYLLTRPR